MTVVLYGGPPALPFIVTLTPEARKSPPKRLLKIWFASRVAVAWFVISIPAEKITCSELLSNLSLACIRVFTGFRRASERERD